jgi:hypothetical protein
MDSGFRRNDFKIETETLPLIFITAFVTLTIQLQEMEYENRPYR